MWEDIIVGRLGRGCRNPVEGGWVLVLYGRFFVAEDLYLGSPRACCLVYFLDSRLMMPRRLQLTSAGFSASYRILTPG